MKLFVSKPAPILLIDYHVIGSIIRALGQTSDGLNHEDHEELGYLLKFESLIATMRGQKDMKEFFAKPARHETRLEDG